MIPGARKTSEKKAIPFTPNRPPEKQDIESTLSQRARDAASCALLYEAMQVHQDSDCEGYNFANSLAFETF
jgi:hypothetical protein